MTTPRRASVAVYRLPEPEVTGASGSVGAEKLILTYPGGAHYDAEALLVDPVTGEIFAVTKVLSGTARVFRAPANLSAGSTTVLSQVGTVPQLLVTGADITAAGDFVALRTYLTVQIYSRPAGGSIPDALAQSPCEGATVPEAQGEAIGFTPDGRGYVTASEGLHPALHEQHAP